MNGENNLLKIAAILQSGIRDEADASEKYFNDIAAIKELASVFVVDEGTGFEQPLFSPEAIEEIESTYKEIIREEMYHQNQFRALFDKFIGITPMDEH